MTKYMVEYCKNMDDDVLENTQLFLTLEEAFDFISENISAFLYCAISEIENLSTKDHEPF